MIESNAICLKFGFLIIKSNWKWIYLCVQWSIKIALSNPFSVECLSHKMRYPLINDIFPFISHSP